jgi:ureidoglycolate hydrolase
VTGGIEYNALVVVNFEPEMRTPRLTVVYVRKGEQGVAVRKYVPHEYHRELGEVEYWKFKTEGT